MARSDPHWPRSTRIRGSAGVAPGRRINRRNRDVDAMRHEARPPRDGAEVETFTAAGIENDVARRCGHNLRDRLQQRLGYAAIVQSPPASDCSRGVARLL